MSRIGVSNVQISSDGVNFQQLGDTSEIELTLEKDYTVPKVSGKITNSVDGDFSKILESVEPFQNKSFTLGIDYGNGDIQKVGLFKLLPSRVNTFKRKRKGKRFIIYKYNIDDLICFNGVIENGSNIQNKTI